MIGMQVHPGRVLVNAAALVIEAFVLLAETPLYGLWTGIITALIILYNFAGVWAMARVLLPKLLGRRGKALVNVIDGWIAPRKHNSITENKRESPRNAGSGDFFSNRENFQCRAFLPVRLAKAPPAIRAKSTAIPQNDGKTDAADQARCFSSQLPISSNTS